MVVQSLADAQYNSEKEEITVTSKHSFCGREKRIVGAVTVIFIQSGNNVSPNEINNDLAAITEEASLKSIPTSLSVINLPHFTEMLTAPDSHSYGNNCMKIDPKCVSEKSFGTMMTEKFTKNLEPCPDLQANTSGNPSDKNMPEEIKESLETDVNMSNTEKNQSEDVNEAEMKESIGEDGKNAIEKVDDPQKIDGFENGLEVDIEDKFNCCQKCLKEKVDVATNTDVPIQNDVTKVDVSTFVCLDDELSNTSPAPSKRKRSEDSDSKEITDFIETEDGNMFIISEVKSSSEDSSESQDSVGVCSEKSSSSSITVQTPGAKFLKLQEHVQTQDSSNSPLSGDLVIIRENDIMDTHDSSREVDENNDFNSSSNVSVVDLTDVPVSYGNIPSKTLSNSLSEDTNTKSVHKTSANVFFPENRSIIKRPTMSTVNQMRVSESQRPKFIRSTSLSKPLVKSTIEICKICKRSLTSLADMFHHSKIHNIGIKCCVCGMKAFDWSVMKHHYTWHIQRNSFKCSQCSTTFSNRDLLAAHMKTHVATKSLIHVKNPKLHPPASKLIVSQSREARHNNLPNLSPIDRPFSNQSTLASSSNKSASPFGRRKFTPVKKHTTSTSEHLYQSNQGQRSSPNIQYQEMPTTESINVNQIFNYSCGCCDEKFVNVEKLKRHVLMYHSEQTMSDTDYQLESNDSFSVFDASASETNFAESDSSKSSSLALTYALENSGMVEIKQEPAEQEIIDIEQLGKFTESMENSRSTTSSDQFSVEINQLQDFEQEMMSSFMENTPSSRQRKTACRLANVIPVCRICGVYLNTWRDILEHRFSHPEEIGQQLACTVCSSVLSTRDSLKRHAINHMGIRHQCQFCHNEYSRKDSLMNHMRSAHGYSNNS